jgi:hypothetical protein
MQVASISGVSAFWRQLGSLGRWWCQTFHLNISWPRGDRYVCLTCGRAWAIPWATGARCASTPPNGWQYRSRVTALVPARNGANGVAMAARSAEKLPLALLDAPPALDLYRPLAFSGGTAVPSGSVHRRRSATSSGSSSPTRRASREGRRRRAAKQSEVFESGTAEHSKWPWRAPQIGTYSES